LKTDAPPKSEWGPGPWQDEPDEARWVDAATGLRCAIVRSEVTGALAGFVEIDHPALCRPVDELNVPVQGSPPPNGPRFAKPRPNPSPSPL